MARIAAERPAEIDTGDEGRPQDAGTLGSRVRCHEAAHAVSYGHDAPRIDAELSADGGILQPVERCPGILEAVRQSEGAGASPRSPVVDRQHVPSRSTDGLSAIEVLLV